MAWDRPNCRSSLGKKNIASIVIAAMDQCLAGLLRLVLGLVLSMTYVYQIMQTQILVAALSATLISSHQDNRERSSQVPKISLSQVTRCLDSASDNYQASEINSSSTAKILHYLSKRHNIKVFNASLGVLGTQEQYVYLIFFGFNLRGVKSGAKSEP